MSYILDALRKADAQRERGVARGIHAQPLAGGGSGNAATASASAPWWWAAAAGALMVAAWAVGHLFTGAPGSAAPQPAPVAQAMPGPPVPTPAPPANAAPVAAARPDAGPSSVPPAPPAAVVARQAAPVLPASVPVRPPPATAPTIATASSPERVPGVQELPADLQRELPRLAISGAVYSDNAAQRMLIVNGQVLGEGAEPAAGVTIEQIRRNSVVLRFRGQRYSVSF